MKLAILIVLYNQQPHESTTLQSLLDADLSHLKEVQLVLWNNGPQLLLERPLKDVQVALAKKILRLFSTTQQKITRSQKFTITSQRKKDSPTIFCLIRTQPLPQISLRNFLRLRTQTFSCLSFTKNNQNNIYGLVK